jgi:hypothetical protein
MSTSLSPLSKLKAEADRIAKHLKNAVDTMVKPRFKFGVFMDDKTITIDMDRQAIIDTSVEALSEMIVREMQGKKTS